MLSSAIAQASSQFASQLLSAAAPSGGNAAGNITALNAALVGKALSYPFWYSEFNLRPYDQLAVSFSSHHMSNLLYVMCWLILFNRTGRSRNDRRRDLPCYLHILHISNLVQSIRANASEAYVDKSNAGSMGCTGRLLFLDFSE